MLRYRARSKCRGPPRSRQTEWYAAHPAPRRTSASTACMPAGRSERHLGRSNAWAERKRRTNAEIILRPHELNLHRSLCSIHLRQSCHLLRARKDKEPLGNTHRSMQRAKVKDFPQARCGFDLRTLWTCAAQGVDDFLLSKSPKALTQRPSTWDQSVAMCC